MVISYIQNYVQPSPVLQATALDVATYAWSHARTYRLVQWGVSMMNEKIVPKLVERERSLFLSHAATMRQV